MTKLHISHEFDQLTDTLLFSYFSTHNQHPPHDRPKPNKMERNLEHAKLRAPDNDDSSDKSDGGRKRGQALLFAMTPNFKIINHTNEP